jgi:hypothetical protein
MVVKEPYDDFDFFPDHPFGELAKYSIKDDGRGEIKEEEKKIEKKIALDLENQN